MSAPAPSRVCEDIVLAAHGTASTEGQRCFAALRDRVSLLLPETRVTVGYVDVQQPNLRDVISAVTTPPAVMPLFLSAGLHVRSDVKGAAATRPGSVVLTSLGTMTEIAGLQRAALESLGRVDGDPRPVVLAAAGSSDARARAQIEGLARFLSQASGHRVEFGVLGGAGPSVIDLAPTSRGILTHLLAPGHFATRVGALAHRFGMPMTAPLLLNPPGVQTIASAIASAVRQSPRGSARR